MHGGNWAGGIAHRRAVAYAGAMTATLRRIAVYVDEPAAHDFRWVLMERGPQGAWAEIRRASSPAATYHRAMADGLLALQGLVDDLEQGPRNQSRQTRQAKALPRSSRQTAAEPDRPSFFGFGPAT